MVLRECTRTRIVNLGLAMEDPKKLHAPATLRSTLTMVADAIRSPIARFNDRRVRQKRLRGLKNALAVFMDPTEFIKRDPVRAMSTPRTTVAHLREAARNSAREHFKDQDSVRQFLGALLDVMPEELD